MKKVKRLCTLRHISSVPESINKLLKHYDNNALGMIFILKTMKVENVMFLIFSSSATDYGIPKEIHITEDTEPNSINPYGKAKIIMEKLVLGRQT